MIKVHSKKYQLHFIKILLCISILLIVNLYRLPHMNALRNGYDDFGYLSIAGFFSSAYDWSGLMSHSAYYSWGYPLVISWLTSICSSSSLLIKVIIVTNTSFLTISFVVSSRLIRSIHAEIDEDSALCVALLANLYIGNVIYAKYAFAESLVVLLFSLIVYVVYSICSTSASHFAYIILSVCTAFIFFVHQRTIGVVLAVCLTIIVLYTQRKISTVDTIIFYLIIVLMFLIGNEIKASVKSSIFASSVNGMASANDFSTQLGVLTSIRSIKYVQYLIVGFIGRLFYFGLATFSVGFIGLISSIRKATQIFHKQERAIGCFYCFIALSFFSTIGIVSLFFLEPVRYDMPFYGRYIEYLFPFFIIEGITVILKKRLPLKDLINMLSLSCVSCISVFLLCKEKNLQPTYSDMIPAMFNINWYCISNNLDYHHALKLSFYILFSASIMMYVISKLSKTQLKTAIAFLLILLFWLPSYIQLENRCIDAHVGNVGKYYDISTSIANIDNLTCILSDSLTMQDVNKIQFMCRDTAMSLSEIELVSETHPASVLTDLYTNLNPYGYTAVYKNDYAKIWKKEYEN